MADEPFVEPGFGDVRKRLWLSLQQLFLHDRYLIQHNIGECSITHRLAVYLEHSFPYWHVDCEFNRDGDDPKLAKELNKSKRPDVIVHRRAKDGPNLLAVEVKKKRGIDADDRVKAKRYINELKYRWSVCISIEPDKVQCEWQGKEIASPPLDKLIWANLEDIGYGG